MEKILRVFIDESGDFGFIDGASKYYLMSLVFHDESVDLSSNIKKFNENPVFRAGHVIRREAAYESICMRIRKKLFQSMFMFTMSLPINCKSFSYVKKEYNNDILKLERNMVNDIYNFFKVHYDYFKDYKIIIHYDNGQHNLIRILNNSLAITGLNYDFINEQFSYDFRLFQVADFITEVRLLELKENFNELSKTDLKFIDLRHLKKNYIKMINKKEIK